ncbi:MAG: S16 family serine protease, partial [Nanoarchaeota archaeon]|nr:S16 family serine protease [Nanoarchaeota archaeon]
GVNPKIEAAINAGIKEVIIPSTNKDDVIPQLKNKVKIITATSITDVINYAMTGKREKMRLIRAIKTAFKKHGER